MEMPPAVTPLIRQLCITLKTLNHGFAPGCGSLLSGQASGPLLPSVSHFSFAAKKLENVNLGHNIFAMQTSPSATVTMAANRHGLVYVGYLYWRHGLKGDVSHAITAIPLPPVECGLSAREFAQMTYPMIVLPTHASAVKPMLLYTSVRKYYCA